MSILKRLQKRFEGATELSFDPIWLDGDDAPARIAQMPESWMRDAATALREDGIAVLKGNIAPAQCSALIDAFSRYVAGRTDASEYRDKFGLHERLANFHMASEAARVIGQNHRAVAFTSALLESPAMIVGSLYFEKGSTQSIHRDTPAFFTNPLNHFFGVWTALEDITQNAGPLTYYRGGHRAISDMDLLNMGANEKDYFANVERICIERGLRREEICPSQGDTVIWHPQLPHGGASRKQADLSRRSIVFHYMPQDNVIMGPKEFFSGSKRVPARPSYKKMSLGKIDAIDQGEPRFFHNRYEGNFDEV